VSDLGEFNPGQRGELFPGSGVVATTSPRRRPPCSRRRSAATAIGTRRSRSAALPGTPTWRPATNCTALVT